VRKTEKQGDCCGASSFVNRPQFLPHEDFDRYPHELEHNLSPLRTVPCDLVFTPSECDLLPQVQTFKVQAAPVLAGQLEEHFRPGFFEGVFTVVLKLFLSVFAGRDQGTAIFGKKHNREWRVIEATVQPFALPLSVVGADTVREPDSPAMGSRNRDPSRSERKRPSALNAALCTLRDRWLAAAPLANADLALRIEQKAARSRQCEGRTVDDLSIRRGTVLCAPQADDAVGVVLGAVHLGYTRLSDNLEFRA
jgi:pantoate--beta-alanine ligase